MVSYILRTPISPYFAGFGKRVFSFVFKVNMIIEEF